MDKQWTWLVRPTGASVTGGGWWRLRFTGEAGGRRGGGGHVMVVVDSGCGCLSVLLCSVYCILV